MGRMGTQVISFVADDGYMNHAKSVLVNCRRQGNWQGDFCMIAPEACDTSDMESRGLDVLRVPGADWSFMMKFWAFTPYFRKWKQALCIDLDIMVQGDLQRVFDGLTPRLPAILCTLEDGPTIGGLEYWDRMNGAGRAAHTEVYDAILKKYPHVTERMFNMSFIFYDPSSIPLDMRDQLLAVHEEFKEANPSKADQMIVNLHMYDRLEEVTKEFFCFFGFDYPENQHVISEFRGWKGDEEPVLLHYCRWMAPWIVKQLLDPEMGGYRNHRLGRICHELYAENLAAFNEEFPVK